MEPAQPEQLRRQCAVYLATVLQTCAWNLIRLKAHLRVPLAMLSRDALLRGADWHGVTGDELRRAVRLDQCRTIEDVCYFFQETLLNAAGHARTDRAQPALSQRVLAWLETNYALPATLTEAARAVGASVPSIIKHIKRDTGKTFHATLAEIRVAEARRLLATTALDLSCIAQQCGYCDQSHFTRQFRQAVNLTPGQFRKLMIVTEAEVLK
ncbi:MAG: AraC family transcriptional regulator [Lentisphaerae bacterium]|nr:AraC family transcriptional regulator [Lentisphaerota bacterium]